MWLHLNSIFIVSIHAPIRERRLILVHSRHVRLVSIHAPIRERRVSGTTSNTMHNVSIHAPIRERQQFYTKSSFAFAIFYTIIPVSFYKNKLYNLYNLINLLSITIISVRISLEIYVLLSFALQTSFLYHKF